MKFAFIIFLITFASFANATSAPRRQHKSHEHGIAKVTLVLDQSNLVVTVDGPGHDFLGFEYKAKSESEKKTIKSAYDKISKFENVIKLSAEALCTQTKFEVTEGNQLEGVIPNYKPLKSNEASDESDHNDLAVMYELVCKSPEKVKKIKLSLFSTFKNVQKVRFDSLVGETQKSETLSSKNSEIEIR